MSSTSVLGRRHVTDRQADTVERLCRAALDEIRHSGYERLTVRNVARRAGVAPATAYTYFASKDHLVTEVFWQQLEGLPAPEAGEGRDRFRQAMGDLGLMLTAEPALAAACTTAMLAGDPDVARVRDRIGAALYARMADALGDDGDDERVSALGFALSGVLMQAGMGYLRYDDVAAQMGLVADLLLGGRP